MENENVLPRDSNPEQTMSPGKRDNYSYDVKVYISYDERRALKYPDYNKVASQLMKWISLSWNTATEGQKRGAIKRLKQLPVNYRRGMWDMIIKTPILVGSELKDFSKLYKEISEESGE